MDEVRTNRLSEMHGKNCLLIIIRDWPLNEKYRGEPELLASLEYLVNILNLFFQRYYKYDYVTMPVFV